MTVLSQLLFFGIFFGITFLRENCGVLEEKTTQDTWRAKMEQKSHEMMLLEIGT